MFGLASSLHYKYAGCWVATPPRMARALADAIPGARLELLRDAGHAAALEQVEAFCEQALGFFDSIMCPLG